MYQLPKLSFEYNAFEAFIDAATMEIHHTKHHQAYTNGLNAFCEANSEYASWSVEELLTKWKDLPAQHQTPVRNSGGGYYNHNLFWTILGKGHTMPSVLQDLVVRDFGSVEEFQTKFETTAKTWFGSGWCWVSICKHGKLHITATPNQDNPLMEGMTPILGLDLWEHAYYLKYQNRRPEYVEQFFNYVNWDKVAEYCTAALAK